MKYILSIPNSKLDKQTVELFKTVKGVKLTQLSEPDSKVFRVYFPKGLKDTIKDKLIHALLRDLFYDREGTAWSIQGMKGEGYWYYADSEEELDLPDRIEELEPNFSGQDDRDLILENRQAINHLIRILKKKDIV